MSELTFTLKWDCEAERKIRALGGVALDNIAQEIVGEVRKRSPALTGNNRRSVEMDAPKKESRRVFTTSGYGGFLEIGTGIYGPKKKPIVPKRAKMLAWKGPGGVWRFARSVKGRRPTPYFRPAFEAVKGRMKEILSEVARGLH